ncbi:MAG: RluA family pseudouridine synthase [Flavobacteriales bacterium]|nr:RluA family pseudouridine synthase [Flavobacteriales bacterium]
MNILWSDDELLAAYKPGGVPVQPDPTGDADLLSLLRAQRNEPGLQLTHRLDRPVSGVVLFGRTPAATASLNEQFRQREVHKVYWAIVEGRVADPVVLEGVVERDGRHRKSRVKQGGDAEATARLLVTPLRQGDRYTLLEVVPEGGAFHQIRAQLSAAGYPIKGDVKYGARRGEKDRSILLHARSITFAQPSTGTRITVVVPVPEGSLWRALAGTFIAADQG